jgi:hypothetical protein
MSQRNVKEALYHAWWRIKAMPGASDSAPGGHGLTLCIVTDRSDAIPPACGIV